MTCDCESLFPADLPDSNYFRGWISTYLCLIVKDPDRSGPDLIFFLGFPPTDFESKKSMFESHRKTSISST